MKKTWHDEAWEDYIYWQSQDKKTLKKINRLLKGVETHREKMKEHKTSKITSAPPSVQ